MGTSEMGTSEMGTSETGASEMWTSEMGTSEKGTSETGTSEMVTSVHKKIVLLVKMGSTPDPQYRSIFLKIAMSENWFNSRSARSLHT